MKNLGNWLAFVVSLLSFVLFLTTLAAFFYGVVEPNAGKIVISFLSLFIGILASFGVAERRPPKGESGELDNMQKQ